MSQSKAMSSRKPVSTQALLRAVASSTAIETGKNIQQLEQQLKKSICPLCQSQAGSVICHSEVSFYSAG
ncbi:hypothetical protein [Chitinilyticum litopenaei]|uniref:hypothetical protein n=1 Tax=Chitinilyticum litopenaei TaxID=1121276 RepID=UPI0011864530|nr:hypothetical protein [Chitinilyticum litopenaei]